MRLSLVPALLILIAFNPTIAQDAKKHFKEINKAPVVYLKDTIFSQGKPYCLMYEIKTKQSEPDYKIKNLAGEPVMEAFYLMPNSFSGVGYYHLLFSKSNNLVNLKTKEGEDMPELIVKNNLVAEGKVPIAQEQHMLDLYAKEGEVLFANGVVYKAGRPYCKLKEMSVNQFHPDLSVRNMSDVELVYIKYNSLTAGLGASSYQMNFPSGNSLKLKTSDEKNIPGILANSDLIKEGVITKDAEEKYILSNGGVLVNGSASNKFTLMNRNTHADIIIISDYIKQDLVTIGNINSGEPFYLNKILYTQLAYALPGGQKVAEAIYASNSTDGVECKITTVKDNQTFTINLDRSKNEKKQIAEFLVTRGYL